jgi:hypothetical protein
MRAPAQLPKLENIDRCEVFSDAARAAPLPDATEAIATYW